MNWRLGLDLGTNSIGWTVLKLEKDDDKFNPVEIINMGSRIFSDGREPKTGEPLAVARRTARGIRRNIHRKKLRRRRLFKQLQADGLFPNTREESALLKAINPYEARIKGLDEQLTPNELGRALFHLGVRRGFKSNRKDSPEEATTQSDEEETKAKKSDKMSQGDKCQHLEKEILNSDYRTIGEFLWKNKDNNNGIRFVPDRTLYYPIRKLYEEEFKLIREKQEAFFPNIDWEKIHHIIFYQAPLRPQARGCCQFMKDKERTFKAMPSSNQFRILQEVYNLNYLDALNKTQEISAEQKELLIQTLNNEKELSFDKIRKLLKIDGQFNLESEIRNKLNGNNTERILRNEKKFGTLWDTLSLDEKDNIVEVLITANEDNEVEKILEKYDLTPEQKESITKKTSLSSGTTSLCKELQQLLIDTMQRTKLQYDKALKELGYEHSEEKVEKFDLLPYYGQVLVGSTLPAPNAKNPDERLHGKIGNPTVHIALNQTKVIVNHLIKEYGKPSQVVVELSRDLKASRDDKAKMNKRQAENVRNNERLNKNIVDMIPTFKYPNRADRLKMKLWEELSTDSLSRKCIYCGQVISANELYTKNIEVEHILPFSRSLVDNESNFTIAHANCNAVKGNKTPFEAFGSNTSGTYCWEDIMGRVKSLKNPVKRARFSADAMKQFEKDSNFIERQLNDNRYLSKVARKYLTAITEKPTDVWVLPGAMTKLLRDKWKIDSILKKQMTAEEVAHFGLKDSDVGNYKKNRFDHRHHALDSLVIGLTDRSMVQSISRANAQGRFTDHIAVPSCPIARPEIVEKVKNIVVSFKPDHGVEGKLSKETYLGKIKQEKTISIKELKECDISLLKVSAVKETFEATLKETNDFKKTIKILSDTYPQVKVFEEIYVARTSILTIKENNIGDIIDSKTKEKLANYRDLHKGTKWEEALTNFSKETGIKKVRCKTRIQAPIVIPPKKDNPLSVARYLNPEDYFVAIIWEIPPKKEDGKPTYQAQYLRRTEVDKNGKSLLEKPHPSAKRICQLAKNDYVEFSENGIWKKARVAGYSATQNILDIRPIFSSNSISDWVIATSSELIEDGWKISKNGRNFTNVNILFSDKSARKITVNPIGKVFRNTKNCK